METLRPIGMTDERDERKPPEVLSLTQVVDKIARSGEGEHVTIGEILSAFGQRSYGPLILVPSILVVSPLSAVPGFPSFVAILVAVIAVQMLAGRPAPWLPRFVTKRQVGRSSIERAAKFLCGPAKWIDKVVGPRMEFLTKGPFARAIAATCLAIAVAMPPLELVPMANTMTAAAISVFGLSLTAHDGLLALVALVLTVAGGYVAFGAFV